MEPLLLDAFGASPKPVLSEEARVRIDFLRTLHEQWRRGELVPEQVANAHYPQDRTRVFPRGTLLGTWKDMVDAATEKRWQSFAQNRPQNPGPPEVIFITGSSGSGKTTERLRLVRALQEKGETPLVIDPAFHRREDPFFTVLDELEDPDSGLLVSSFGVAVRLELQKKALNEPNGTVIVDSILDPQFSTEAIRDFQKKGYRTEVRAFLLPDAIEAYKRVISRAQTQSDHHPDGSARGRWVGLGDGIRPDGSPQKGLLSHAKETAIQFATTWTEIPELARRLYDASTQPPTEIYPESRRAKELLARNASLNRQPTSRQDLYHAAELADWREKLNLDTGKNLEAPFQRVPQASAVVAEGRSLGK